MSLWCRTRGRQNSRVIQIHPSLSLCFSPSFSPFFLLFLRSNQSWVLSASWGAESLPEATSHGPFIKSMTLSGEGQDAVWTNELSARYEHMCVLPLYIREGILLLQAITTHKAHLCHISIYRGQPPPPPPVWCECPCVWCESIPLKTTLKGWMSRCCSRCSLVTAADSHAKQMGVYVWKSTCRARKVSFNLLQLLYVQGLSVEWSH